MIKFLGLDCNYDEENEPVVGEEEVVLAKWAFDDMIMTTIVQQATPFNDWTIQCQAFADIWRNANARGERFIYEATMTKMGVDFIK